MRRRALPAALVVVLVTGGCVGLLGGGGDVDPATIDERVESELADVETLRVTINQTVSTPNGTHTVRFRVSYERPDRVNFTVLDGQVPWTYAVSNASGTWLYNASADRATFSPGLLATEPRDLFYGIGPNATFFESRSALVSGTDLTVPEPSVPADYEFQRGAAFDSRHRGVELTYANGPSLIEVAVVRGNASFVSGGGTVRVDGVEASYAELPRAGVLEWHCGNQTRVVVGQNDRETLVSVARSVGC